MRPGDLCTESFFFFCTAEALFSILLVWPLLGLYALGEWVYRREDLCSVVLLTVLVLPLIGLVLVYPDRHPDMPPDPDGCDQYPRYVWTMTMEERSAWRHECKCCRNERFCRPGERCAFDPRPPTPERPRFLRPPEDPRWCCNGTWVAMPLGRHLGGIWHDTLPCQECPAALVTTGTCPHPGGAPMTLSRWLWDLYH